MEYTYLSKVDAINHMLSAIDGELVSSLENPRRDVAIAILVLDNAAKEFQAKGWSFNRNLDETLARDVNGEIKVQKNVVKVDVHPSNRKHDSYPVLRPGIGKLYDTYKGTTVFEYDVEAEVVYLVDWADMPEQARNYLAARGARILNDKVLGDRERKRELLLDEQAAMQAWQTYEDDKQDHNMLRTPISLQTINRPSPLNRMSSGGYIEYGGY